VSEDEAEEVARQAAAESGLDDRPRCDPRTMAVIMLEAPIFAESCPWVRPFLARASRIRSPMVTPAASAEPTDRAIARRSHAGPT